MRGGEVGAADLESRASQAAVPDLPSDFDYSATKNGAIDGAPCGRRQNSLRVAGSSMRWTGADGLPSAARAREAALHHNGELRGPRAAHRHRLDALRVRRQAAVVPVRVLRAPGYPAVCRRARVRMSPLPSAGLRRASWRRPISGGLGRAQKIRRRLGGGADDPFGEFPAKPRGMHRRTYERWRRVHDAAEERSTIGLMGFVERLGRRSSRRA